MILILKNFQHVTHFHQIYHISYICFSGQSESADEGRSVGTLQIPHQDETQPLGDPGRRPGHSPRQAQGAPRQRPRSAGVHQEPPGLLCRASQNTQGGLLVS